MRAHDLSRLAQPRREFARRRLAQFLAWALHHACVRFDLIDREMTVLLIEQARGALQDELGQLADRGAFLYFGIADSFSLGPVDVVISKLPIAVDRIAIANLGAVIDRIMSGGARGVGWVRPSELTSDDLA